MQFSVIIPNYNHEVYLYLRIQSVLNQTYSDFEVIILDDCSTDNSREIIEMFRGHKKITHIEYNEKNSGSPFKQWEKGFELAQGELIWIAESDDVADITFLERIIPYFKNPNVKLVFSDSKIINEHGDVIHKRNPWIHETNYDIGYEIKLWDGIEFLEKFQRYRNYVSNASSAVFRKKYLNEISTDFMLYRYTGDWFFWNQLLLSGDVCYIPETLNSWRNHKNSTRSVEDLSKDYLRLNETTRVIRQTNRTLKSKPDFNKYHWIIEWWMSRYSYQNLFNLKYIIPPIYIRLIPYLYKSMIFRTFKELKNSAS